MNPSIQRLILVFALLAGLFVQPLSVKAQGQADIEAELTAMVENFAKDYVALPNTKNADRVIGYMDESLTYSIFVLTISGRSRAQRGSYENWSTYIRSLIRVDLEELRYDVSNIHVPQYSEKNGTVTYNVSYETKEADGLWVKGKETVTMAMEKKDGDWKVVFYNIVQVEDEKYKGTCLCEIFASQSEGGEMVVKTTIPSGRSYTTKFDNFEFRSSNGETMIKTSESVFRRLGNGKVVAIEQDEEIELGMAQNKRDIVLTIVRDYLYKDSCARLRVN